MEMMKKKDEIKHQDTELRLGLPGTDTLKCINNNNNKRSFIDINHVSTSKSNATPPKAQVVGWPPVRSYRKNYIETIKKEEENNNNGNNMYVKVSMDGAPYLRKIDIKLYSSYSLLLNALHNMFNLHLGEYSEKEGYKGGEYVVTYEDKDGDWMLVGDVPWQMFINSCKRLRIMKASDAKGLAGS